ncbi:MAG: hypothetical protein KDE27_07920 [Planctomycetes bacterium]|nr:hypothetical protein [Planctomycetota bacterium]
MRLQRLVLAAALALAAAAHAQDDRESTVGMRRTIEELALPGTELAVKRTTYESPIALRIAAVRPHGSAFRYDLEWTGLEAGTFDLRDYLVRKDGSAVGDLPAIEVRVTAVLPADVSEPLDPAPERPAVATGYTTTMIVAGVIWILGLLAILFVGRRRREAAAELAAPPTLADRLRPFVASAASGTATDAEKAELERLLVAFWRERLELQDLKADRALAKIREHGEAGHLLRQLEAWLHIPHPPQAVDVEALLRPYRDIAASAVEGR